jgi:hypothetical protein
MGKIMTDKIVNEITDLKLRSENIYKSFIYPLHKLGKSQRVSFLKNLKLEIDELSRSVGSLLGYSSIQFSKEIESEKIKNFQEVFSDLSGKIQQQIFFEEHSTEIDNDLVNIKKEISLPEIYFNIEQITKNQINNLILFLESAKKQIEYKYIDLANKRKSVEELLAILDKKENLIKELNQKIDDLRYLDAKEKSKDSRIANLEEDLIKSYKASEQDLTIFKLHVIQIERTLEDITRQTKQLVSDINHLETKIIVKEQNSLELIKELKTELITNKYLLNKK